MASASANKNKKPNKKTSETCTVTVVDTIPDKHTIIETVLKLDQELNILSHMIQSHYRDIEFKLSVMSTGKVLVGTETPRSIWGDIPNKRYEVHIEFLIYEEDYESESESEGIYGYPHPPNQ